MYYKKNKRFVTLLSIVILMVSAVFTAYAAESYTGKINTDKVFFRMQSNTNCGYHAVLKKGDKVAILGIKGEFYKARFDSDEGYIMKKFVDLSSSAVKKLNKNVEQESKSKYAKVSSIRALGDPPANVKYGDRGEDVEKLQRALQLKKCYQGVVDGKFGNMTRDALKVYQKKNGLSVTGKTNYDTIKKLFGKVSQTTAKDDPKMKGITSINKIPVPNTTRKNNSGRHVTALQQALKLKGYYDYPIDGKYGNQTVQAVKDFQKRTGLKVDGTAGNSTIKKLFGKNAANYTIETEKLDWFNGGSTKIPKGGIFSIKDIGSGKVFTVKRWSGYNHIDAEPLNAKQTQIFKEAVGGEWSWSRRPILVKYNGHVYAASMNSMPHEDDTISGNDYKGHFCIHFSNSKTHGTDRRDPDHQNAVQRALNYTW
ncbi:MAG: peptidoglycan-binding protein [Eubacteriales bacterium]|nr:peptidoglycan-binding protein [Eubacteriales bacterium]